MAALAVCPTGAVAEVYSCEIKEWVRVNDEGLVRPAPSAPFKRHVSIDKETGNSVGDALSVANRWEVAQKGSQENAFVTLGYVGSRLLFEIAVYEFKIGREKPLIIDARKITDKRHGYRGRVSLIDLGNGSEKARINSRLISGGWPFSMGSDAQ